jgi:hypothetical protein
VRARRSIHAVVDVEGPELAAAADHESFRRASPAGDNEDGRIIGGPSRDPSRYLNTLLVVAAI